MNHFCFDGLCATRGLGGGRCAAGLILRWFSLRENSAAMLGGRSRCGTRCALRAPLKQPQPVRARSALRAPTLPPALLATAEIAPPHTARRQARTLACHRSRANTFPAKPRLGAHCPGGASGTPSSARVSVGARSALRALTRRSCLSGARKARAASSSARPNPEQHRGVAVGDRSSEAPRAVRAQPWLCRAVQRTKIQQMPTKEEPLWA
jgi:hypothetical protein